MEAEDQRKKRRSKVKVSKYRSTAHVTPKHIMNDARKHLDPTSLEMILILKLVTNSGLWDESSVNAVIKRSAPQRTERDITSTPISTVSSSATSTAQSFFSTYGNQRQRFECDDDDNEGSDEDEGNEND